MGTSPPGRPCPFLRECRRLNRPAPQHVARIFHRRRESYEANAPFHHLLAHDLLAGIQIQPETILEVGSHTGLLTRLIRERWPEATLITLDIQNISPDPSTPFVQANAEAPPFAKSSFDLVVSGSTAQWFHHWKNSIQGLHDLLRPGGQMAFSQFTEPSLEPLRSLLETIDPTPRFLPLQSMEELKSAVMGQWPRARVSPRTHKEHHPQLSDLLRKLRRLGVGATGQPHRPLSRSSLRALEQAFEAKRCGEGLPLELSASLVWADRP